MGRGALQGWLLILNRHNYLPQISPSGGMRLCCIGSLTQQSSLACKRDPNRSLFGSIKAGNRYPATQSSPHVALGDPTQTWTALRAAASDCWPDGEGRKVEWGSNKPFLGHVCVGVWVGGRGR